MDDLSPEARALVQTSRKALRATAADRERATAALRARLGADVLPLEPSATAVSSLGGPAAIAGAGIGVCVLGAIALLALRSPSPPEPAATGQANQTLAAPPPSAAEPPPPTPEPTIPETPAPAVTPAPRPRDPLAREVALLSQATRALRTGKPSAALRVLEQHQRQFPNGALGEERQAAKAEALCALGRVRQGRSELAQLAPQTPAAAHARQACDAVSE